MHVQKKEARKKIKEERIESTLIKKAEEKEAGRNSSEIFINKII